MILDEIVEYTRKRVEKEKKECPLERQKEAAIKLTVGEFPFEKALRKKDISFICEVKKASPSKGVIVETFLYKEIAKEYEIAGASAISVLTEPKYFLGKDLFLQEIRQEVKVPLLRKDFVVDEYQLYQAKNLGADCVLLICSVLSEKMLKEYSRICDELGLSTLVEAHDEEEVKKALNVGARIIGVNNRNLKDFTVNVQNSIRLRSLVPREILFVAESGIESAQDIKRLKEAKVDAVLIGETLMRSSNKKIMLKTLAGSCE